jgi:hypothetical protein
LYLLNGKRINIDAPVTLNDVQYPNLRDPAWRVQLGVIEVPDPVYPNPDLYFWTENEDGTLTVTPKELSSIVSTLYDRIKDHRDNLMKTGGAKVGTKWYHSDTHSKVQQLSLVTLGAGLPAGIEWKTMDGTFEPMTQTLAVNIFQAQVAQEQAIFQAAESHKENLLALQTVEQIAAYDWKAGWPEVYVE